MEEQPRRRKLTDEEEQIIDRAVKDLVKNDYTKDISAALKGKGEASYREGRIVNSVIDSKSFSESLKNTQQKKQAATLESQQAIENSQPKEIESKGSFTERLQAAREEEKAMEQAKCGAGCSIM